MKGRGVEGKEGGDGEEQVFFFLEGQGRGGEGTQPYAWHQTCADFLLRCVALPMLTPEI